MYTIRLPGGTGANPKAAPGRISRAGLSGMSERFAWEINASGDQPEQILSIATAQAQFGPILENHLVTVVRA